MPVKVSIIVPVYNCEAYITKCIDSILENTFKDFELILINDASTDSSPVIIHNYKSVDHRIRVIDLSEIKDKELHAILGLEKLYQISYCLLMQTIG